MIIITSDHASSVTIQHCTYGYPFTQSCSIVVVTNVWNRPITKSSSILQYVCLPFSDLRHFRWRRNTCLLALYLSILFCAAKLCFAAQEYQNCSTVRRNWCAVRAMLRLHAPTPKPLHLPPAATLRLDYCSVRSFELSSSMICVQFLCIMVIPPYWSHSDLWWVPGS